MMNKQENINFYALFLVIAVMALSTLGRGVETADPSYKDPRPVGKPLATSASIYASQVHPLGQTSLWGPAVSKRPFPTNEWWNTLVLGSGNNPVKTYPYLLKAGSKGLTICYPGRTAQSGYITETFLENLIIESEQSVDNRELIEYGKLHATMRWNAKSANGHLTAPIVRGQVYNTVIFQNLKPRIRTIHVITKVNGKQATAGATFSGKKFKMELNNGQQWLVYSAKDITFTAEEGATSLLATGQFDGYIRAALLAKENMEGVLDSHSATYPTSGTTTYEVLDVTKRFDSKGGLQNDIGKITFKFSKDGDKSKPLLMFVLPHHQDTLVNPKYPSTDIGMLSIKGMVRAVIGDSWIIHEPLTNIGFGAQYEIPEREKGNLRNALNGDKDMKPDVKDPYFGGKAMAKIARLALIADDLGEKDTATKLRTRVKQMMEPWINGDNPNHLVYDNTWGGVVTTASLTDPQAEFGMGWYNDHHFHFGYWVYSAAVVIRHDEEWGKQYKSKILDLVRDYANPVMDEQFPELRHKDWYTGHSFASGLFEFSDIKNQESTSEAVNGYYALVLLGRAMKNQNIYDMGRLLLATEIRTAKKYWHMPSKSDIYDDVFKANKLVGILWETKVDYATFFGANVEFIHCIQMMPFTPITEELLPKEFIKEEYNVLKSAFSRPDPPLSEGWKGLIYMAHSIFDKEAALREISGLKGYDDGNTKTNTLHFVATRPGPDNPKIVYEPTVFEDDPGEPGGTTSTKTGTWYWMFVVSLIVMVVIY